MQGEIWQRKSGAVIQFPPFVRGVLETLGVLIAYVFVGLGWAALIEGVPASEPPHLVKRSVRAAPTLGGWGPVSKRTARTMQRVGPPADRLPGASPVSGSWTATTSSTLVCSAGTGRSGGRLRAGISCSTWLPASMSAKRRSG